MKPAQQQRLRGERYRRGCRKSQLFIYFTHDPQTRRRECRVLLVESFAVASSPLRGTSDLLLSTFRGSEVAATSEPLLTRGSRYIKLGYRGDAISSGSEVYGRRKSGVNRRRLIVPGQISPRSRILGVWDWVARDGMAGRYAGYQRTMVYKRGAGKLLFIYGKSD